MVFIAIFPFSVIIGDLDVVGVTFLEPETDTPLIVYGYRMLPHAVPRQCMQSIAGRHLQIIKTGGNINILKPPSGPLQHISRQPFRFAGDVELLRMLIPECLDHRNIVTCLVTRVKWIAWRGGKNYMDTMENGAPGVIRTPGTRFRKPLLYPPELQGRKRCNLLELCSRNQALPQ